MKSRLLWLVGSSALITFAAANGCSGDNSSTTGGGTPDASTGDDGPAQDDVNLQFDTYQPPADTGPTPDTSPGGSNEDVVLLYPDAGEAGLVDGEGGAVGIPCYASGILEGEPDDTVGQATNFPPRDSNGYRTICGQVAGGGSDHDFLRLVLTQGTSTYNLNFQGSIKITLTVQDVGDGGTDGGTIVIVPGQNYTLPFSFSPIILDVVSNDASSENYRITIQES
jgi:hypothetical protein